MKGILCGILVLISVSVGKADFTVFTDRTAFESAATGAGLALDQLVDDTVDPGDPFTITGTSGSVTLDVTSGLYNPFFDGWIEGANLVSMSSISVTGTVAGIGFGYLQGVPSIQINGGTTETGPSQGGLPDGFFGVLATDGMSISVVNSLNDQNSDGNSGIMRDITIATGVVPEPSSALLVFMSMGLFALSRKR